MALSIARRFNVFFLMAFMVSVLAACVTTERGGIASKADQAQALETALLSARHYVHIGNWQAAKRHLKTAIEIDDSSAEVYEAMALVYQNTGEFELAEQNYKKSINIDSGFSRVRNNYAAFLYQQQRYEEAVKQLVRVVADTFYNKRSNAYINLGQSYLQLAKLPEAEQAFYQAHLMASSNLALLFQLAEVNYRLEHFSQSQKYYDAYHSQVKQQSAPSLWLGIRLADKFGDNNAISSYTLALKNLYPESKEYLQYREIFNND